MIYIPDVDNMTYDLCELLGCEERDFLIRNNGDQVEISSLKGKKTVAIYFCQLLSQRDTLWCSEYMTPLLVQVYREIGRGDFEVVMVSFGEDEDSFCAHFAQMPWLAVPYADSEAVKKRVLGITRYSLFDYWNLTIVDKSGKILIKAASDIIRYYGAEAYPFTPERIAFLNEREAVAKQNQSLTSLLGDHLLSGTTRQLVPVAQLVGKTVALFFQNVLRKCKDQEFTDLLVRVHKQLRDRGAEFEVVFVPLGVYWHEDFLEFVKWMPWLALLSRSKHAEKLWYYFSRDPNLPRPTGSMSFVHIIGPDGKTLNIDGGKFIRLYGADAFPFTPRRLNQLELREKRRPWTLETLLAFHGLDFVIRRDGSKVAVDQLVGKTIMLYFWESVSPPSHKIMESCRGIRAKDEAFEVICIGFCEKNLDTIEEWMFALPPNDVRYLRLVTLFDVICLPRAIVLDSSCRIVRSDCACLMGIHGADAYPFTEDHLERLAHSAEEIANSWPEKVNHRIHQHEIDRVVCEEFDCDGCYWSRNQWNFRCTHCGGFDLHADYAFGEDNGEGKPAGRNLMNNFITNMTSPEIHY